MIVLLPICILCSNLSMWYFDDIVERKYESGECMNYKSPSNYIKLLINNENVSIEVITDIDIDRESKEIYFSQFFSYSRLSDIIELYTVIKEDLYKSGHVKDGNFYLIVKISEDFANGYDIERFNQYDVFINNLRTKVNELNNWKLLFFPYYESNKFIDLSLPDTKHKEYKHDILSRIEVSYHIYDITLSRYSFMSISSNDLSDEFLACFLYQHLEVKSYLKDDFKSMEFMKKEITAPLLRHFNPFRLQFMSKKLNSAIKSTNMCLESETSEDTYIWYLNDYIIGLDHTPFFYHFNIIHRCLKDFKKINQAIRFIQILVLIKSKCLVKVFNSIFSNINIYLLNFMLSYLSDTNVIPHQAAKDLLSKDFTKETLYFENIVHYVCTSDILPISNVIFDSRKFYMLLYIGFVRTYRDVDVISIMDYVDKICYTKTYALSELKQKLNETLEASGCLHLKKTSSLKFYEEN